MKIVALTSIVALLAAATPAFAEFQKVSTRNDFVALMSGKTLTRPFVKVQALPDGRIAGTGAAWSVSGEWQWKDGYFCRTLFWGNDNLGYNCQEVLVDGDRVRITSDRGKGRSADFKLR
jgi:hypothetical protein